MAASSCKLRSYDRPESRRGLDERTKPYVKSDAELAKLLRRDPKQGGQELFECYAKRVEYVLVRLLGTDSEIRDIIHDVFLTAISSVHRLQSDDALRGWLMGIAVNKARNLVRKRKVYPIVLPEEVLEFCAERHSHQPGLHTTEALRRAQQLLLRLPAEERRAFTLTQLEAMSLSEIAQEMRVSVSTVKRRAERGQGTFVRWAKRDRVLVEWLERGSLA